MIKKGINYDYIIALCYCEDKKHLCKKRYAIARNNYLLENLESILQDEDKTVQELYMYTSRHTSEVYNYCLGRKDYNGRYILPIEHQKLSSPIYRMDEDGEKVKRQDPYSILREKNEKILMNDILRKERLIGDKEAKRRAEENYLTKYKEWEKKQKNLYFELFTSFIYAEDYTETFKKIVNQPDIIFLSHENLGYNKHKPYWNKDINEDTNIAVFTNFGFGNSSYFYVRMQYKGIMLCPYSAWVTYYKAGYAQLLRYTRWYNLDRENWNPCVDFVVSAINQSIDEPDSFVEEFVMNEVNSLMDGLEKIYNKSNEELRKEIHLKASVDNPYVGIRLLRDATPGDILSYELFPNEAPLVWKLEKIGYALNFLDSLKQFSEIYTEIKEKIHVLIDLNKKIEPEVDALITKISNIVDSLQKNNADKIKRSDFLYSQIRKLEKIVAPYRSKVISSTSPIGKKFDLLRESKEEYQKLSEELEPVFIEINRRNGFIGRLKEIKETIINKVYTNNE